MPTEAAEARILRSLAQRVAELAAAESNRKAIDHWTRLNALDSDVPPQVLVHLWPLAWDEVLPDSQLQCTTPWVRRYERDLRRTIWTAEHLDSDNVVEPVITYPLAYHLREYQGLQVQRRYVEGHGDGAAEFVPVILEKSDVEQLGEPALEVDEAASERNRQQALELFDGLLTVVKQPVYFAAKVVDEFSWLRGLENTYWDMVEDPVWVNEALGRIAANFQQRFELLESAGLWGVAHKSFPLGSAGLRFAPNLPDWRTADDPSTFAPKLSESWGNTCAEVCNVVSPEMHDRFAFEFDRQLMRQFRYINVGCCETLDTKTAELRRVPNVRKVSVSEWCDVKRAAENLGSDYVYSYRAAGVHFVRDPWDIDAARAEIQAVLDATRGSPVELVLNIGGTLGEGDGGRKLAEWCRIVRDLIGSGSGPATSSARQHAERPAN